MSRGVASAQRGKSGRKSRWMKDEKYCKGRGRDDILIEMLCCQTVAIDGTMERWNGWSLGDRRWQSNVAGCLHTTDDDDDDA